jgi:ubiquitin C-terminal hydrolase
MTTTNNCDKPWKPAKPVPVRCCGFLLSSLIFDCLTWTWNGKCVFVCLAEQEERRRSLSAADPPRAPVAHLTASRIRELGGVKYRLKAIVHHLGQRAGSGHYVADVKVGDSNLWDHCDDSFVSRIDESAVLHGSNKASAYLLYYEQVADGT